jgi:formamidopyrimidine-DNA glycosylase
MPELPEVETMRRGILGVIGATIVAAGRLPCALKPILVQPAPTAFRRRAVGRRVVDVERIGKRVVLRLDTTDALVLEPRMTGLVLVSDPPDREHLRFRMQFSGGRIPEVLFWDRRGLGSVRLLSARQLQQRWGAEQLGPDALSISALDLQARLRRSRRAIKVALLDQRMLTGIGNLYAAEILHVASIHPQQRCDRLGRAAWERLHAAMRQVLQEAIRYEGSTLSDGTYRNVLSVPGSYQSHHQVYDRAGERCLRCGAGVIRRIVQAQRATFYCPQCQRKR